MELDDSIPEVYLALGMHEMYYEWDFAAAENHLLHALELNPSQIAAVYHYAWLMEYFRNTDKSLPAGELTVELDPLLPDMSAWLAEQYRYAGQYERAIELAENALELDPSNAIALMSLGTTYAQMGDFELALRMTSKISTHAVWGFMHAVVLAESGRTQEARDLLELIDKVPRNVISLILVNSALGEVDEAFQWMEVARDSKLPWYPWFITMAPFMDEVRADPRMRVYAEELGIEDVLDDVLASL